MALVLDVARYKYPPYWCQIDTLFNALSEVDTSTNKVILFFKISLNN